MSESKVKEQNAVPLPELIKDLITKAVDEKQGNDEINVTVDTIMKRIMKETVHRADIVFTAHMRPGSEDGTKVLGYLIGKQPRYIIEQAQSRMNHELYSFYAWLDAMQAQKEEADKKIITPENRIGDIL